MNAALFHQETRREPRLSRAKDTESEVLSSVAATEIERMRVIIEQSVSQVFCVDTAEIERPTRGPANVALARQVAMYIGHVTCGQSLTEVGRTFARDRTTVAHACGLIEDRRDDPVFDHVVELLERVVRLLVKSRDSGGRCLT